MSHKRHIGLSVLVAMTIGVAASAETVFLARYDAGLAATFNRDGKTLPLVPKGLPPEAIRTVPGKFGDGVRLERLTDATVGYDLGKSMTGEGGTIEFWYRPEWDTATILPKGEGPDWLQGHPVSVSLFNNMEEGSGLRVRKNQYNVFEFALDRRTIPMSDVAFPGNTLFKKGQWTHIAVSWDRAEARLFVNGRLLAVSDTWDLDYFQSLARLGGYSGGSGAFDEFRISNDKRYIGSFPAPDAPYPEPNTEAKPRTALKRPPENPSVLFVADFREGLDAVRSRGDATARTNRPLEVVKGEGLRLRRHPDGVADTLCYAAEDNFDKDLGRVELTLVPGPDTRLPATLFESVYVADWTGATIGVQFILDAKGRPEWRTLRAGKIVDAVTAPAVALKPSKKIVLAAAWANSLTALYVDAEKVAERDDQPLPPRTDAYFFVGSDCRAENAFDGLIESVQIQSGKEVTP